MAVANKVALEPTRPTPAIASHCRDSPIDCRHGVSLPKTVPCAAPLTTVGKLSLVGRAKRCAHVRVSPKGGRVVSGEPVLGWLKQAAGLFFLLLQLRLLLMVLLMLQRLLLCLPLLLLLLQLLLSVTEQIM